MKLKPLIQNIPNKQLKLDLIEKYNKLEKDYIFLRNEILFYNNMTKLVILINSLDSKFNLKALIHNTNCIVTYTFNGIKNKYHLPESNDEFIKLLNSFLTQFNKVSDYNTIKKIISLLNNYTITQ